MTTEATDEPDIRTRADLAHLLRALAVSRVDDPGSWANDSLEAFLESMAAWLDDMDGYFASRGSHAPSEPTWRLIAEMALAARVYE